MTDLERIFEAIRDWSNRHIDFALATVVGTRGSTYRGLGARQLVAADGASVGTVSGGCLDAELHEIAGRVIATGQAEVVEFDLTADDEAIWGWGIGCNGATELLVEPAASARELSTHLSGGREGTAVVHRLAAGNGRAFVTAQDVLGDIPESVVASARKALGTGQATVISEDDMRYMIEVHGAPPRLVVCGAGHDAAPLVRFGAEAGFEVVVVDERRSFLTGERFPEAANLICVDASELSAVIEPDSRTYVVLISHNYTRDLAYLESVLGTDVAYIGALGPGARLERLLNDIDEKGVEITSRDLAKIHGPAGLDLGADGPIEIALAVVAEILAVSRSRDGGFLADRKGPESLQRHRKDHR